MVKNSGYISTSNFRPFKVTAINLRWGINFIFDATTNTKWKGTIKKNAKNRKLEFWPNPKIMWSKQSRGISMENKQRVLMHGHQGWNVRHGLCHIYMIYVYIWVVYSFCLFCCLFIIVTTQFVALYKPCKPKPSTYDPPPPPPPPPPPGQPPPGRDPKTDT